MTTNVCLMLFFVRASSSALLPASAKSSLPTLIQSSLSCLFTVSAILEEVRVGLLGVLARACAHHHEVAEELGVREADRHRMAAAHGEAAERAVRGILQGAELRFDKRDDVLDHVLAEERRRRRRRHRARQLARRRAGAPVTGRSGPVPMPIRA